MTKIRTLALLLGVLLALSAATKAAASPVPRTAPIGFAQVLDIQRMERAGLAPALEWQAFGPPGLLGPYSQNDVSDSVVPSDTIIYTSYGTLKDDFASGALPKPGITWITLDLERWDLTPLWQQRRPAYTESLAAKLIHAHGLKAMFTPAVDLLTSMGYKATASNYLKAGLASGAARYGDGLVIQGQRYDRNLSEYAWFIGQAARQARNAHPGVSVNAGLSTCAGNVPTSASSLLADYRNTHIAGYWLNVPIWRNCPDGNPQSAITFLQDIY